MFNLLPLTTDGEGHSVFTLGDTQIELVTRFNYTASFWTMDILDSLGNLMIGGLALVPNVDLIKPYPQLTSEIGALVLIEQTVGEYMKYSSLGLTTFLLWFPVGTPVVLP